jgi:hypothetical protein
MAVEAFRALVPRLWGGDRFYSCYLGNDALLGIWAGGQFYDKSSVRTQLVVLYFTIVGIPLVEWIARVTDQRRRRLVAAAEDDMERARSLPKALEIPYADIASVEIRARRSWWTIGRNSGTLTIHRKRARRLKLIMIGKQDVAQIGAALRGCGVVVSNCGA